MAKPIAINLTATTTEQNYSKIAYGIKRLQNLGDNDIKVCFNEAIDDVAKNYFLIKAGAGFDNWMDVQLDVVYYKSVSGTSDFFIWTQSN